MIPRLHKETSIFGDSIATSLSATASKSQAVSRSQRIYHRKATSGAPSPPSTASGSWVTAGNDGSHLFGQWTTKVPRLTANADGTGTKYLYLYTCEQREMADGTLAYTTVLLDDSATVIDGGSIVTGTIDANKATITNISASNITTGTIAADRIKANVISAVNDGTGTINADKINASGLTIGYSQLSDPPTIPSKVSDLTNDSNFATQTEAQGYVDAEANQRKAQYGTCSTAAGTAAKVVTCSNFALYTGARIVVKFTTANTAAAPTLNVNSTGAKAIWNANAVASATNPVLWGANATLTFVYDGTEFVLEDKAPSYSIACSTAAATAAKAATVTGALVVNGTVVQALFSTANTVSAAITFNLSATGAATIYRNRAATSASNTLTWTANTVLTLVRNAQYWYLADNGTRTMSEDAAKTATNYITQVDSNGITIHPSSGTTNRTSINADGMTIYQNDVDVANFGATARIGQASGDRVVVDSTNGVTIYKGTTKRLQTTSDGLAVFDDQNTAIATFGIGSAQLPGMALGDNTEIYYISDNDENALIMSVDSTTENKEARTALYAESSQSSVLQDCMSEIAADADSSKDHYASASLAVWNHYNSANNRKYAFISVAVDDDQGSLASISADALAIFNGDVSIEKNVYANKKLEVYQSLSAQNILIDRSINNYSGYAINATGKHSFSSAAPSSGDVADLVLVNYDSDESLIGYMQIVNTTDGVYRSFVVQNPRTLERTGLYAKAFDDGTSEVFTSSGTLLRSYTLQATNRVYSHGGLGGIGGDSDYYYFVDSTNGNLFRFNKTTGMIHFKRDGSWAVRNSCITAVVSSALSLTEDWATVTLSSNVSHGGELTISSGGVKCARAGTVKVSANCYISGMNGDNVGNAAIYKGSTSVAVASQRQLNDRVDLAITPKLISVSANDVLYLKARNTSSSTGSVTVSATMTYMTVEYIN